jgi:hypothetical protein
MLRHSANPSGLAVEFIVGGPQALRIIPRVESVFADRAAIMGCCHTAVRSGLQMALAVTVAVLVTSGLFEGDACTQCLLERVWAAQGAALHPEAVLYLRCVLLSPCCGAGQSVYRGADLYGSL